MWLNWNTDKTWFLLSTKKCHFYTLFYTYSSVALLVTYRVIVSYFHSTRIIICCSTNLPYMHGLREPHLASLKHILRYVRGTQDFGLQLYSSSTTSLYCLFRCGPGSCRATRRSTSSYCVFLGNNLYSWSSMCQHTLSRSNAEAEYRGVANVAAETTWSLNLLRELHTPLSSATLVDCDNVTVVYMTASLVQHQWMKHIEIDIHFVRDMVAARQVRVLHVPSLYQGIAFIFCFSCFTYSVMLNSLDESPLPNSLKNIFTIFRHYYCMNKFELKQTWNVVRRLTWKVLLKM